MLRCGLALLVVGAFVPEARAAEPTGAQIYAAQCAKCHGAAGEGNTDEYADPLVGDKSVLELTALIDKTMPAGKPELCVGEDARKVAAYIHETFYSPVAQDRNRPARIELARLTIRQYQNAVADLIGTFRSAGKWDDSHGLKAEYFKSRRMNRNERAIERIDPQVQFDFGKESPDAEKIKPDEFSIRWEGSVLAPDTGEYEFVVRTDHAARLWVNDLNTPLVDAWVKSGSDTEYRQSIRLLAGRVYPLRLEFSKAKQGVNDPKLSKSKPGLPASIALLWQRPHLPVEVIAERNLTPVRFPQGFVPTTPFPPDDRSIGYVRGTTISKAWDQATTDAAIEVANYVTENLRELSGAREGASDREQRLREFAARFVELAFRRPLTDEVRKVYVDQQFERAADVESAVKRSVLLALKSPRFLYREVGGTGNDPYSVAARISFGLWDSAPDAALLAAAGKGELHTREQVRAQAERMLGDLRSHAKLREFFRHWLKIEQVPDLAKDAERFPHFDATIAADLRTSLELFVDDVVWSEAADFRQLLLADSLYLNGRLASHYNATLPADAPFQKVQLPAGERAGALTHPYLMAGFAYTATSSPIHRGVFVSRNLLGRALRPPPIAVSPLAADVHEGLTTRERIALQTQAELCMSCHSMINPLGFTLENYDAIGRYRTEEAGRKIDSSGSYRTRTGEVVQFGGMRDLAEFLANSDEAHAAFVEQMFHHVVKQPIRAFGSQEFPHLRQSFAEQQFNIRKLVVEIVASTALVAETPANPPQSVQP